MTRHGWFALSASGLVVVIGGAGATMGSTDGRPMWTHSVEVAVSSDEAWRQLSDIRTGAHTSASAPVALRLDANLHDAPELHISGGPSTFVTTVSVRGATHRVKLQLLPEGREVAVEGEWWFRGVIRVEPVGPERSRLVLTVHNVARAPGHLLVPLVARGLTERTQQDLAAIARTLEKRR